MKKSEALEVFQTQQNIANILGITKSSVSQWGEKVPPLRAYQLAEAIKTRQSANDQQIRKAS